MAATAPRRVGELVVAPRSARQRRGKTTKRRTAKRSRFATAWLVCCLALAAWLGFLPPAAPANRPAVATRVPTTSARAIESIRIGQRVMGENPDLAASDHSTATAVDPRTWRLLRLHGEERWSDGTLDTIEVETLQPLDWLREHRARRGAFVPLPIDLTEMGLPEDMRAKVVAIEPCPEIADGPGHVVTSTVNHLNRFLLDLEIANNAGRKEKITTTGYHKFYSATRSCWVSACELRRGERLRGADGALAVAAVTRSRGVERVYNFSVEGEHVYHVSVLGALVHNPSCEPTPSATPGMTPDPLDPNQFHLTPLDDSDDLPGSDSQILPPGTVLGPGDGWDPVGPGGGPWSNPVKPQ